MSKAPKYLFNLRLETTSKNGSIDRIDVEVFGKNLVEALLKLSLIMPEEIETISRPQLKFITENFECPKCSTNVTVESECRL